MIPAGFRSGRVHTTEHIQAANDMAAKKIQETCKNVAAGAKGIYSPAHR